MTRRWQNLDIIQIFFGGLRKICFGQVVRCSEWDSKYASTGWNSWVLPLQPAGYSEAIWPRWGGGIRSIVFLTQIGFHFIQTVRINLLVLQAAACAGWRKLGCIYQLSTSRYQRVDGRPDLHWGVSPDPQSLDIHLHVHFRTRRRGAVQRNFAVHDVTT
jgi:hypothetical protein